MRYLVTGATGHVGTSVVRHLVAQGEHVCVLVRPQSDLSRLGDAQNQVEVSYATLQDGPALWRAVREAAPDAVIHLAWGGITAQERNDATQITVNLAGTLQLLEATHDAGCRHFVGLGSQAEYGTSESYGLAKYCAGLLCRKLCASWEMSCAWFRLIATYGPHDDPRHLIPSIIEQLLDGKRPALSPGEQVWDYLYVQDAAEALCKAAQSGADGVWELGSGDAHPIREVATTIRDLIDPTLPLGLGDLPYRDGQIMHLQADVAPLQVALGWMPQTSLSHGLHHTIEWHRQSREGR